MKKVIYVLTLYDYEITGDDDCDVCDKCEVLSAYDSWEEAEKGLLKYYNEYIALNYNTPIANNIKEMEIYLEENNFGYEIDDVYYYTR